MVIVKVLGFMDLLSAITIILMHYNVLGWRIGLIVACYLIFKGIVFLGDIASIIDLAAAVYVILLMFHFQTFLAFVFSAYLLEKSIVSML